MNRAEQTWDALASERKPLLASWPPAGGSFASGSREAARSAATAVSTAVNSTVMDSPDPPELSF
jgi:hypothetical protein